MLFDEVMLSALPAESRFKVEKLDADRQAAVAAYRAASDREQATRQELQMREGVVSRQIAERGPIAAWSAAESERLTKERDARLIEPLEPLRRAHQAALDARERAAEAQARFSFLHDAAGWLQRNVRPGVTFHHCAATPPKTPKGIPAAIDQIRAELVALNKQRDVVENAPLPPEELLARCVSEIDRMAEQGALRIDPRSRGPSPLDLEAKLKISATPVPGDAGPILMPTGTGAGPLIAWLCRDLLAERVERMIADLPTKGCLTDAEREAQLAEIAGRRLELERVEESLIVAAANAGLTIDRRREADPRAVLEVEI